MNFKKKLYLTAVSIMTAVFVSSCSCAVTFDDNKTSENTTAVGETAEISYDTTSKDENVPQTNADKNDSKSSNKNTKSDRNSIKGNSSDSESKSSGSNTSSGKNTGGKSNKSSSKSSKNTSSNKTPNKSSKGGKGSTVITDNGDDGGIAKDEVEIDVDELI